MIPYSRQIIEEDDIEAVAEALRADLLTTGPGVEAYEEAFAASVGARYAVAVSSGTAGLHLACLAANVEPGSDCVTSPLTFAATANAALYCGSSPRFADIRADTLCIDPERVQQLLTSHTAAILPVHFAGHPCDLPALRRLADKYHCAIIEDACHALGASTSDGTIGDCRYSDMAVFSTHPVKAIATGEGGVITTNRPQLYERLKMLRSHGITRDPARLTRAEGPWYYEMQMLGLNYRICDVQCALGRSQLKKLGRFVARRREISARYQTEMQSIPGLCLPTEAPGMKSAWHLFVVRCAAGLRSLIFDRLRAEGLGVNVHYLPVYLHPYYQDSLGYSAGLCPIAERAYRESISLPLHAALTDEEVTIIIATVRQVLASVQPCLRAA